MFKNIIKNKYYFKNSTNYFSLAAIIFFLGCFLRIYNLEQIAPFVHDNARELLTTYKMWHLQEWVFRGPVFSIVWGFLSPIYYYLLLPIFALAKFNPIMPTIVTLLADITTLFLMLFVTYKIFGKKASLMAGAIYAVSLAVVKNSLAGWNPSLIPPFAVLLFYGLWQILKNNKEKYLVLVSLCLAMLISFHPSGFFVFPGLLVLYLKHKPKFRFKTLFWSAVVFGIFAGIPYAIQEKKFAFWTLKRLWEFFTDTSKPHIPLGGSVLLFANVLLKNISQTLLATTNLWGLLTIAPLVTFVVVATFQQRKLRNPQKMLTVLLFWYIVTFALVVKFKNASGTSSWWLHTIFIPWVIMLIGVSLSKLTKSKYKYIGVILILIIGWFNLKAYQNYQVVLNLAEKKELARFLHQNSAGQDFDVYGSNQTTVYYLLWYYEKDPQRKEDYWKWLNKVEKRGEELVYLVIPKDSSELVAKVRHIYFDHRGTSEYKKVWEIGEREVYRIE